MVELEELLNKIRTAVENMKSTRSSYEYTGSTIDSIETALVTSKIADEQVATKLKEYIKGLDEGDQKQFYTDINNRKKDTILQELQDEYDIHIDNITKKIYMYNILEEKDGGDANEYYRLKNNDIREKLMDISGIELTNKRKAFYNLDYVNNIQTMKDKFLQYMCS